MTPIRLMLSIVIATAWSPASAETMRFEEAAAMLAASCAKDIDSNCRGVNPDPTRLKDCLTRNQDVLSPQCKNDTLGGHKTMRARRRQVLWRCPEGR
jgi:hypothetical protein